MQTGTVNLSHVFAGGGWHELLQGGVVVHRVVGDVGGELPRRGDRGLAQEQGKHLVHVIAKLLTHGAVQDEVYSIVSECCHVERVRQQHVDVDEEVLVVGAHQDDDHLRHLGDDVHDDDDQQHHRRALVAILLLRLVARLEQPLLEHRALVELLQQESYEEGDQDARDELAHDGIQPERHQRQD